MMAAGAYDKNKKGLVDEKKIGASNAPNCHNCKKQEGGFPCIPVVVSIPLVAHLIYANITVHCFQCALLFSVLSIVTDLVLIFYDAFSGSEVYST